MSPPKFTWKRHPGEQRNAFQYRHKSNMKIIHFVLLAGLSTGLTFAANAQQPAASIAPSQSPRPEQTRHRHREQERMRNVNGTAVKERRQEREREKNGVIEEQRRQQRTNGEQTQSRSEQRSKNLTRQRLSLPFSLLLSKWSKSKELG